MPRIITPEERKEQKLSRVNQRLPSATKMTKNLAKSAIDLIRNGINRRSKDEAEKVLNICSSCPKKVSDVHGLRCGECGCYLGEVSDKGMKSFGKIWMQAWHCPLKKW